ncbi:hypothetical protein LTR84_009814 [Exophiala bonariae]|uniref:Pyruvate decarboxylase n=1 Tax=Exophiala bonariae TaxID=1690606 RepID=A0AAV9NJR5_9EURO|nr:hypothetical protein LTR84_009814 [Exophiala bonariae]
MGKISLAQYLFTRLRQNRVKYMHGVPGDFTLKALDYLKPAGLQWINSCNELNAGYAADGYARVNGMGALFTTYGVGELSAINAIAGSFAEHVPVVSIVGTPQRQLQRQRLNVHHTLGDGRPRVFAEMAKHVTAAQAHLFDENEAPEMIDEVLTTCLRNSQPVYIDLPCDMVAKEVPASRLDVPLNGNSAISKSVRTTEALLTKIHQRLQNSKQPLLLIDSGHGVRGLSKDINSFAEKSGIPTLAMPSGNGMVSHSLKNFYGVHSGPVGRIDTMPYVGASDLVISIGGMFSDTQTLGWQVVPDENNMIVMHKDSIRIPGEPTAKIALERFLPALTESITPDTWNRPDATSLGNFRDFRPTIKDANDHIDQENFYLYLNEHLRQHDIVLLANATPILGGRDLILPESSRTIASGQWFSIGHMLPAAQGAALAQWQSRKDADRLNRSTTDVGRTILLDGDGSFQATAQELSTVIRYRIPLTIFIVNNSGYAYERHIHGLEEDYNNLAPWRYSESPFWFGARDKSQEWSDYPVSTAKVETWSDLGHVLNNQRFTDPRGLKLIEVIIGKYDVPTKFEQVFKAAGEKLG